ncbi:hypothetical protein Gohar_012714 [Gossypium harknessii]|uniref:Uncharacterized protein n=1 Tax=Gossypium harknessii TaxID=34285 RepID=A0A7J9GY20_9ROSI|nr:hypothetical protein [Gossypium harknessii]
MVMKEASPEPTEANPAIEDMDLENLDSFAQNPNVETTPMVTPNRSAGERKTTKKLKMFPKSKN